MASTPKSNKYRLRGYSDVLDGRLIQFVDELPADLPVCSLCSVVPRDYHSLSCEHAYCGECFLGNVKKSSTVLRCPVDRRVFRPRKAVPSATADFDALRGMAACCFNKDDGCSYIGTLEELQAHDRDCYVVSCRLCSTEMLRSLLFDHVEAAHSATTKTTSRRPKRGHEEAVVPPANVSSSALVEAGDGEDTSEVTKERVTTQPVTTYPSHERVEEVIEAVATRIASIAVEDAKRANRTMLNEVLRAVKQVNDRLTAAADAASVSSSTKPSRANDATADPACVMQYTWTVCQYSKIRAGIHRVASPTFIAPGYRVQITICLDGIASVELSASVKVHRDEDSDQPVEWPFKNATMFTIFDKSRKGAHVTKVVAPKHFKCVSSTSGGDHIVSDWLTIGKVKRTSFERDYIEDDGFTVAFSI
ncbi:hypothetical protein HPB50_005262 [Hyalomma asiaticum]|uniref:Uncharacterized protein n=1 Tax=Hyalomma asiaticum TaxID=266040 RepID=A0ACB7T188_HYAAI|nr:hypothetical protein HPB50_005262 [Hyalomma asiaticum]